MLKRIVRRLRWEYYKASIALRGSAIAWRNRLEGRSVTGAAPVAVSLTTHGSRLETVHLVIESICAGRVRPVRMVLWLNGDPQTAALPAGLARLRRRGLEIRYVENYGPHTKYYPYVASTPDDALPLVTADDDMLYPRYWLERLVAAHAAEPQLVHCYRARRIALQDGRIGPYRDWGFDSSGEPSFLNFGTGVSGVLYPPSMLRALRRAGEAFRDCCPRADDIWLHAVALRSGHRVKQLGQRELHFDTLPDSQGTVALFHTNMMGSGNDDQVKATYRPDDLRLLAEEAGRAGPVSPS